MHEARVAGSPQPQETGANVLNLFVEHKLTLNALNTQKKRKQNGVRINCPDKHDFPSFFFSLVPCVSLCPIF